MIRAGTGGVVALGLGALLHLTGCSVRTHHDGTEYRCDDGVTCPPGFACVADICTAEDGVAGRSDSGLPDPFSERDAGPGGGLLCGTTTVIHDDFDNNTLSEDRWWPWSIGQATAVETGGELVLTIAANGSDASAGIFSQGHGELNASRVMIEIASLDTSSTLGGALVAEAGDGDRYELGAYGGQLFFASRRDGVEVTSSSIAYVPAQQRLWQLREDRGAIYAQVSADGVSWSTAGVGEHIFAGRVMRVGVQAFASRGAAAAQSMRVRNVNGGSAGGAAWCPSSVLSDSFDGDRLDSERWRPWGTSTCTLAHTGGELSFGVPATGASACGVSSRRRFDMREGQIVVELPGTGSAGVATVLEVRELGVAAFRLGHLGGAVFAERDIEGSPERMREVPYDPLQHRWWRLRAGDGWIHWEASGDGVSWTELTRRALDPGHLAGAEVLLYASAANPGASSRSGSFSSVNRASASLR